VRFRKHKHNWGKHECAWGCKDCPDDLGCLDCKEPRPYHLQPYTYRYDPKFVGLPQPWRNHPEAANVYELPFDFLLTFADRTYLNTIQKTDKVRLEELKESMLTEGLKVPVVLVVDSVGKFRYHDGYHRLAVVQHNLGDFPKVPCLLQHSSGIVKAFGRPLQSELETILKFVEKKAE
jgi:hypothetical protein